MKVGSTGGAAATSGAARGSRSPADGFSLSAGQGARESAAVSAPSNLAAIGSLDALLALQEMAGPLDRRRRAVKRAGGLLDMLDEVKLSLLDDAGDPRISLGRLSAAIREARHDTEDARLESLLNEIETRAAVELAKDEVAHRSVGMAHDNSPRVAGSH